MGDQDSREQDRWRRAADEGADSLRGACATSGQEGGELFDAAFLGQLEYLRIVSQRAFAGLQPASRRGLRAGAGLEFSEHRPYALGDDFRYLDWAAYGRLDKLLLRLFQQDEDLSIALLVDVSDSMVNEEASGRRMRRPYERNAGWHGHAPRGHEGKTNDNNTGGVEPRPYKSHGPIRAARKVDYARRLAAALAYIGLSNLDHIRVSVFADGEVANLRTRRGRGQIFPVLDFLKAAPLGGPTNLALAARQFEQHVTAKGLVVVISDFLAETATAGPTEKTSGGMVTRSVAMKGGHNNAGEASPAPTKEETTAKETTTARTGINPVPTKEEKTTAAGYEEGLGRLHHGGHEVWALMVESPEEAQPPWQGEVALVDAETGGEARMRLTPEVVARYLERRQTFLDGFDRWTLERGIAHLRTTTAVGVDQLVLEVFRRGGFLK